MILKHTNLASASLKGRVLAPPSIQYKASKVVKIRPNQPGGWRPSGNRDLYVDGQNLDVYAVLDLSPARPGQGAPLTEVQFSHMIKGFYKVGNEVCESCTYCTRALKETSGKRSGFQFYPSVAYITKTLVIFVLMGKLTGYISWKGSGTPSPHHVLEKLTTLPNNRGVNYTVMVDDVETVIEDDKPKYRVWRNRCYAMTWADYHDFDTINKFLDALVVTWTSSTGTSSLRQPKWLPVQQGHGQAVEEDQV